MRKIIMLSAAAVMAAAPLTGAALAQNRNVLNQQGGLVNVSVANLKLLTDFANNNEIEILNNSNISLPITVQAPISVAAAVCGVDVNVLARGGPSTNNCPATSGSEALTDLAITQIQD